MCKIWLAALMLTLGLGSAVAQNAPAPQVLIIVACQVDDLTGQPGRHGVDAQGHYNAEQAAKGWRDLELRIVDGVYQCKREQLPLEDAANMYWPSKVAPPLNPNFGNFAQCARTGMMISPEWTEKNKGWGVVAVGCPTPIGADDDNDGQPDFYTDGPLRGQYIIKGWALPGCPSYLPGTTNRMKCRFDASEI